MAILILFVLFFVGGVTLILVRLSISCIFWASKYRHNKMRVFKRYFPYYIISLSTLCLVAIIELDQSIVATYYFSFVFTLSLFIWRYEIIQTRKKQSKTNINNAPHHPELP